MYIYIYIHIQDITPNYCKLTTTDLGGCTIYIYMYKDTYIMRYASTWRESNGEFQTCRRSPRARLVAAWR